MFNIFDFNHDGKVSAAEFAMGMEMMDDIEAEEIREKLEAEGLDFDELAEMDEWDRRQALEEAGLDPDDFDCF